MNNWQKNHVLKQITEFSFPLQMPTCSCSAVLIHRDPTILYLFIVIKQFLFSIYSIYITCSWHIFTLHVCIRALFQKSSRSIRFYLFFLGKHVQYGHEQHRRRGSSGRGRKAAASHRGVRRSCGSRRASSSARTRRVAAARPVTADTQPNKKLKRPNKKKSHRR